MQVYENARRQVGTQAGRHRGKNAYMQVYENASEELCKYGSLHVSKYANMFIKMLFRHFVN